MNERIKKHIDLIFESAPKTRKAMDLKEELLLNTNEKFQDLISNGYSEEDAFQNVIASIGDVTELFDDLEDKNLFTMREADRKKRAIITAIAIGLYIFAGIAFFTCVLIDDSIATTFDVTTLGLIMAAAICIIPTCMLVYVANMYPEYQKKEENMVENYKESKSMTNKDKVVKEAVSVIIWMIIFIIYFLISFTTMAWYITWVIFLIGACVQAIAELIFSLKRND
ncbi:MAG TPA: permease prefix domain 1-containing protein [Lachnospiraceae bacterium]|nr:permease prefix domain 1-containing protein [Lachnospiraceae bacterium]